MNIRDYYYVDGKLVYWEKLIEMAIGLDEDYHNSSFQTTSQAARILKEHGYTVEEPKEE